MPGRKDNLPLMLAGGAGVLVAGWWFLRSRGPVVDLEPGGPAGESTTTSRSALSTAANTACIAAAMANGVPPSLAAVGCSGAVGAAGALAKGTVKGAKLLGRGTVKGGKFVIKAPVKGVKLAGKGAKKVGKLAGKGAKKVGKTAVKGVKKLGKFFGLGEIGDPQLEGYWADVAGRSFERRPPACAACLGGAGGDCCDGRAFYEAQFRRRVTWR